MENRDTIIIGAGPSGCKAGQVLADHGKDVLILEKTGGKNAFHKICHGMMPANNMAMFHIPKSLADTYLDNVVIYTQKEKIEVKFPFPLCYMVHRQNGTFGRWLAGETRKKGVEIREDSEVIKLYNEDKIIELKNGEKIKYNNLMIANGSGNLFRKQLGLKSKSVLCTYIEVPYSDLEDKRKTTGHLYLNFETNGVGYSGYVPYKETVSFCQVFCNDKFFTKQERIKRFNEYIKKVEGVDLENYEFLAKTVNYMPLEMRQKNNTWIIGDSGGFGDIAGGLISTCAKSGEIAAHDILGLNIKKEIADYFKKYDGASKKAVGILNNKLITKKLMENYPTKVLTNKLIGTMLFNKILSKAASLFIPFPGDEWNEFDQQYYSKENFGYDTLKISRIRK